MGSEGGREEKREAKACRVVNKFKWKRARGFSRIKKRP
jgi:hypothetical protein